MIGIMLTLIAIGYFLNNCTEYRIAGAPCKL